MEKYNESEEGEPNNEASKGNWKGTQIRSVEYGSHGLPDGIQEEEEEEANAECVGGVFTA